MTGTQYLAVGALLAVAWYAYAESQGGGISFEDPARGEEGYNPTESNQYGQDWDNVENRVEENEQADNENPMAGVRF